MPHDDDQRSKRANGFAKRARGAIGKDNAGLFSKFTARGRTVLVLAQEEAQQLGHNHLGTEHLLLGLLSEGDGVGARALTNLGVTYSAVRDAVDSIVGQGTQLTAGELSFTPRSKKVLELAHNEAKRLRHNFVGTEHLLMGLLLEGEGVAAEILREHGIGHDQVQAEILSLLARSGAAFDAGDHKAATTVVMSRLDDRDLQLLDMLVEAGVRSTRSDAASWLIHAGIEANRPLFEAIAETVTEIRRLRERASELAQQAQEARPSLPEA